jgi:hypothetical protein
VVDYDDEENELLKDAIESRSGRVVGKSFKGVADYAVVPLHGAKLSQAATEVVTHMWVVSTVGSPDLTIYKHLLEFKCLGIFVTVTFIGT